jgi:hypothetical protein
MLNYNSNNSFNSDTSDEHEESYHIYIENELGEIIESIEVSEYQQEPISTTISHEKSLKFDPAEGKIEIPLLFYVTPFQPLLSKYPSKKYGFKNRSFSSKWYTDRYRYTRDWMEYSIQEDAIFCLWCRHFASTTWVNYDKSFSEEGMSNWKKAVEKIESHEKSGNHIRAHEIYKELKLQESDQTRKDYISKKLKLMSESEFKQRQENTFYITKLFESIIYLAKQGLALRGHLEHSESDNRGNFIELLEFLGKSDPIIFDFLKNPEKTTKYLSPAIQNELISIVANEIRKIIKEDIGSNKFSIIADGSRDINTSEQLCVAIRYVSNDKKVKEAFIGMYNIENSKSETIYESIKKSLYQYQLSLKDVRGCAFDGASNMKGHLTGVRTLLQSDNSHAYYFHCFAHSLNLALLDSISSRESIIFFKFIQQIYTFINASPNRLNEFSKIQADLKLNFPLSIKEICIVRWSSRYDAIKAIDLNLPALLIYFKNISNSKSEFTPASMKEAVEILNYLKSSDFVIQMSVFIEILFRANIACKKLQGQGLDCLSALKYIEDFKSYLEDEIKSNFESLYQSTLNFISKVQVEQEFEKILLDRNLNPNLDDLRTLLINKCYFNIVTELINELTLRFNYQNVTILKSMNHLLPHNNFDSLNCINLKNFLELYELDFDDYDIYDLPKEIEIFKSIYKTEIRSARNILEIYQKDLSDFPVLNKIYKLCLSLPPTSVVCERIFSAMSHILSVKRSSMNQDRFENLLLIYCHKNLATSISIRNLLIKFMEKNRKIKIDI